MSEKDVSTLQIVQGMKDHIAILKEDQKKRLALIDTAKKTIVECKKVICKDEDDIASIESAIRIFESSSEDLVIAPTICEEVSDTVTKLIDVAEIGDYVDATCLKNLDKFRVLWKDLETGEVALISETCPIEIKKPYEKDALEFCKRFTTEFAKLDKFEGSEFWQKMWESLFSSSFIKFARSCTKEDLEKSCKQELKFGEYLPNSNLYRINHSYWLFSPYDNHYLWLVYKNSYLGSSYDSTYGVRPVIVLQSNVSVSWNEDNESWQII